MIGVVRRLRKHARDDKTVSRMETIFASSWQILMNNRARKWKPATSIFVSYHRFFLYFLFLFSPLDISPSISGIHYFCTQIIYIWIFSQICIYIWKYVYISISRFCTTNLHRWMNKCEKKKLSLSINTYLLSSNGIFRDKHRFFCCFCCFSKDSQPEEFGNW